jgi:hypothetical protein
MVLHIRCEVRLQRGASQKPSEKPLTAFSLEALLSFKQGERRVLRAICSPAPVVAGAAVQQGSNIFW